MRADPGSAADLTVIKVGGRLASLPGALERVCAALGDLSLSHRIVVVPGGGPFADAVREFDARLRLSADAAHWMALLAMDQYAQVLAGRIPGAVVVDEPGMISDTMDESKVAVLAPSRWMRSADVLPHTWEVTSDSIAAFVAGALDAKRLVLIKPTDQGTVVDSYFTTALPRGMPYLIVSWDRIEDLASQLKE